MEASLGDVAALIAAVVFALLVGFLSRVLWKLGGAVDDLRETIQGVGGKTMPLLGEVTTTVGHANHQLEKVDTITTRVSAMTESGVQVAGNVSTLTALFTATLGSPMIRVAALSYGLREALAARREGRAVDLDKHPERD
ncbi:MAG: DUF948 domain-containing protein [Actinomycetales bacterium]